MDKLTQIERETRNEEKIRSERHIERRGKKEEEEKEEEKTLHK